MDMTDERYVEIEQAITVFSFSKIQSLLTLVSLLEGQGIELEELKTFVKFKKQIMQKQREQEGEKITKEKELWVGNAPTCPVCSKPLLLRAITIPEGTKNLKGYTSQWICDAEDCIFEEYGFEDVQEVYKQVLEGAYNANH